MKEINDMRAQRKSFVADLHSLKMLQGDQQEVRDRVKRRASVAFNLTKGTEAADLVIENQRLKATLEILNQKVKNAQDSEKIIDRLKSENDKLRNDYLTQR